MKRPLLGLFSLTAWLLTASGCQRGDASPTAAAASVNTEPITAVPDKDRYKVTADTTGFFHYSPLQPGGSDFDLKKDTRLTMLQRGRGFSQIKTEDNKIGYVGTEDIAQLAPNEIAQENAATLQAAEAAAGAQLASATPSGSVAPVTTVGGKKSSAVVNTYTIPSAADINTRLPEPDARAKASPSPSPTPNSH